MFGQAETTFDHRVEGALRSGHDRGALYGMLFHLFSHGSINHEFLNSFRTMR